MRYAVVADIHGNIEAFQAVIAHAHQNGGFDAILCLGDVVGYGPNPHQCLELLRAHIHVCVPGNHDLAAAGSIDTSGFNPQAAAATEWTSRQLTDDDRTYLMDLPELQALADITLVHGSPRSPPWEYITSSREASENLSFFETSYCLVGHTHVPLVYRCRLGEEDCVAEELLPGIELHLSEDRMIINPGGVGQPRDGIPAAAYALLNTDGHWLRSFRVEYPIARTQEKMLQAGLPSSLIRRLSYGL